MDVFTHIRKGITDLNAASSSGVFAFLVLWYAAHLKELSPNLAIAIFGINFVSAIIGLIVIEHLYNFILNRYDSNK